MEQQSSPCMHDHSARRVKVWLPEMQSSEFLRASIAKGERTAECWAELSNRRQRVYAARRAIAGSRA